MTDEPKSPTELFGLDQLKKTITDVVASMFKDKKPNDDKPGRPEPEDIAARVRAEVEKMTAQQAEADRNTALDELLQKHKEAKDRKEEQPIERRRVHKIMGWGEP